MECYLVLQSLKKVKEVAVEYLLTFLIQLLTSQLFKFTLKN